MLMNPVPSPKTVRVRKSSRWVFCSAVLLSFAAGSLVTGHLMHLQQVRAESHRVFELMVYHTIPGKVPALESIFRDVSKIQSAHGLDVIGYWTPDDNPIWKDTFVYVVAHPSREEAKKNWDALHKDPAFLPYRRAGEPLIDRLNGEYRVDEVYMHPTEFSALR